MARHVVRSFGGVNEALVAVDDEIREKPLEIPPDVWISVLIDDERGAGVENEDVAEAVFYTAVLDDLIDPMRDVGEAAPLRLDGERPGESSHPPSVARQTAGRKRWARPKCAETARFSRASTSRMT